MKRNKNATKKKRKIAGNEQNGSPERIFGDASKERLGEFIELAELIARSFNSKILSFEERRQFALIGIAHGLETYREGLASEETWLSLKARYSVQGAIRQEIKKRRKDPTAKQVQHDDKLFDLSPDVDAGDYFSDADERTYLSKMLGKALERLDQRTRDIVLSIHFQNQTQKGVSDRYGISPSWASRLYARGLKKLRFYLLAEGVNPDEIF